MHIYTFNKGRCNCFYLMSHNTANAATRRSFHKLPKGGSTIKPPSLLQITAPVGTPRRAAPLFPGQAGGTGVDCR